MDLVHQRKNMLMLRKQFFIILCLEIVFLIMMILEFLIFPQNEWLMLQKKGLLRMGKDGSRTKKESFVMTFGK